MYELENILYFVEREHSNLTKSKYRARAAEGIEEKKIYVKKLAEEFEQALIPLEEKVSTEVWNRLTDAYEIVRNKVQQSLLILNQTTEIPKKGKKPRRNSEYILEIEIPENYWGTYPTTKTVSYRQRYLTRTTKQTEAAPKP